MRRALACAAALAALLLAAPAHAFVLGGHAWPGARITYFDADRAVAEPVALAVHAWNASGAHVRFVAVPRSRARVVIQKGIPSGVLPHASIDQGFCTGFADIGYQGRQEHVYLDACSGVVIPSGVIAHELGHILGLGHETRRCATMEPLVWTHCNQQAKGDWQYRCRIVQPDDVAGA